MDGFNISFHRKANRHSYFSTAHKNINTFPCERNAYLQKKLENMPKYRRCKLRKEKLRRGM
jgi:hypothetical protein